MSLLPKLPLPKVEAEALVRLHCLALVMESGSDADRRAPIERARELSVFVLTGAASDGKGPAGA